MVTLSNGFLNALIGKMKSLQNTVDKLSSSTSGAKKYGPKQIPVSAWKEEDTEDGYRYAASISLSGVTADNVPIITFADEDVDYFYPTAQTGAGTVTVWADDIPDGTVTVKSIVIL